MSRAVSYVVTDDALLASPNVDLLKQALDVKAGSKPALADDSFFTQQLAALHADRIGTFYLDAGKAVAAMPQPSDSPLSANCMQLTQAMASVKYVGELRAESDHLAFNMRAQTPTGANVPPAPQNKTTTLAQAMPNDTMVYLEMRNAGANLGWMIKNLLACSATQSGANGAVPSGLDILGGGNADQLFEQFLGAKPEDYFNFLDDVALGVTYANDKVGGGIVATVDDQAVATQRVDKLLALLQMVGQFGGAQSGTQIATQSADHNGVKVTTVTVTGVGTPDTGAPPSASRLPPRTIASTWVSMTSSLARSIARPTTRFPPAPATRRRFRRRRPIMRASCTSTSPARWLPMKTSSRQRRGRISRRTRSRSSIR
jgi:hypothetical protein